MFLTEGENGIVAESCKRCGMCCKAIPVKIGRREVFEKAKRNKNKDFVFISKNWVPISCVQATMYNGELGGRSDGRFYYYTCLKLSRDNLCTVHKRKPKVCSGYPWYGKERNPEALIRKEGCGYAEILKLVK